MPEDYEARLPVDSNSRDNLRPLRNPRYYSYDVSMDIFLCNLIFLAGIWRTGLSV